MFFLQGAEVDVDDIKRVYSLFLDEHRSTQFLQVDCVCCTNRYVVASILCAGVSRSVPLF